MTKVIFAAFVLMLSLSTAVFAAPKNGNPTGKKFSQKHQRRAQVNKRVENQRDRIDQGVKSGKLTKGEAKQLRANDKAIKAQEHADVKAHDGHITKGEQKQLNQEENANSKLIYDEKHPK